MDQELKELMECFPNDMDGISNDFESIHSVNQKLLIETIVFGIIYAGLIVVLIYTFNYLDADYWYWIPALAVVALGLLTIFLIYNSCRFAASFQLGLHSSFYSKDYSQKVKQHYDKLEEINNNIEIKLNPEEQKDQEFGGILN